MDKRDQIAKICGAHGVERLSVFGSALSDTFDPEKSDIDFLVEFDSNRLNYRFDDYFGLKEDLEALLGFPVDLVSPSALKNPFFAHSVLGQLEELYAE
jgi:hypothetical protein